MILSKNIIQTKNNSNLINAQIYLPIAKFNLYLYKFDSIFCCKLTSFVYYNKINKIHKNTPFFKLIFKP